MDHDPDPKNASDGEGRESRSVTVRRDDGSSMELPAKALCALNSAVQRGVRAVFDALAELLTASTGAPYVLVTTRTRVVSDRPEGDRVLERLARSPASTPHDGGVPKESAEEASMLAYEGGRRVPSSAFDDVRPSMAGRSVVSNPDSAVGDGTRRFRVVTRRGELDVLGLGIETRRRDIGVWVLSGSGETFSDASVRAFVDVVALAAPLVDTSFREESLVRRNESLREVAEFFRAMFDQSGVGVVLLDLDGHVLRANPAFCDMLGYTEDELVGLDSRTYTSVDTWDLHEAHVRSLRDGASASEAWEKTCVRKDGSRVDVLVGVARVFSTSSFSDLLIGVVQDITGRKRVEEQLRQERERVDATMVAAGVGTWAWMPTENRIVADATFSKMLALPEEQTHSVSLEAIAKAIHPDDLDRVVAEFLDALDGNAIDTEYRVVGPSGAIRWIFVRGQIVRDERGHARAAGVALDITERRQAEEALRESDARYRLAMRATNNAIWDWNIATDEIQWNVAVETLFGHPAETQPEPFETWGNHIHPEDRARVRRTILDVVGKPSGEDWSQEYRFLKADGTYADVLDRAYVLRDRSGRALRMIGALQDLSERKRVERERLLDTERVGRVEAERTSQMKDEFLATLSHELRTPLNAMLGWAQILKSGASGKSGTSGKIDVARGIEVIERNARAQAQIIEDLLDMSRIISGKVRLDAHPVDMIDIVQGAIETARLSAEAKNIAIVTSFDAAAGTIMGDPNRLQQVMWNLLSNAVKFTPKGGRIDVRIARIESHLEVTVTDTGEGIPPEFLPHVFDRFRQADASTTRKHGGLGLGLAIVKQLAELHGGTVRVDSKGARQGATFSITLPVVSVVDRGRTGEFRYRRSLPELPRMPVALDGVRVLVVDDEADARALIERFLEDAGAEVETASSVDEAMERLEAQEFDVLVSDIGMPEEDGYSLLRRVRALGRTMPAIALTAYASAEDRVRALVAGFKSHLTKPVEAIELIATVASTVGRT